MRQPDYKIGTYMNRWYLIPRNDWFNVYLHQFIGSDEDRCLHDHPWWSVSFLLKGNIVECYHQNRKHWEHLPGQINMVRKIIRFLPYIRSALHKHRIVLRSDDAWTIFITGPKLREWGFWPRGSWVSWQEYLGDDK